MGQSWPLFCPFLIPISNKISTTLIGKSMAGVLGTRTQGCMSRRRRNHGALATAHEKELVLPKPVEIANEHRFSELWDLQKIMNLENLWVWFTHRMCFNRSRQSGWVRLKVSRFATFIKLHSVKHTQHIWQICKIHESPSR